MRPRSLFHAPLLAAGLVLPLGSAAIANIVISVDKTTQHMSVSVDGTRRYRWPVSTGRPGYDTPDGTFHPAWMSAMHYSKEYEGAPMPDAIFFSKGDAIHGFTDTPFGVAAVSHGCVRLPRRDAAALFQLVQREGMADTTIVVHGRVPQRPVVARRHPATQEAENEPPMTPGFASPEYVPYGGPVYDAHGRPAYDGGWRHDRPPSGGDYGRAYSPYWP